MRSVSFACLVAVAMTLSTPVLAEDKAAARQAYAEGSKYYDVGQYAEALESFKRAYFNYEEPVFLYNMAQCHRALGHKREAVDAYRSYLRKSPNAANRGEVQDIITELNAAIERDRRAEASKPIAPTPTVTTTTTSPPSVTENAVVARPAERKPVWKRGWFWGVIGGVAVVGAGLGVGLGLAFGGAKAPKPVDGAVSF
jgi:tetratricopeptide (TPR) repeat protein